jgi:hypothetical protein
VVLVLGRIVFWQGEGAAIALCYAEMWGGGNHHEQSMVQTAPLYELKKRGTAYLLK